MIKTYESFIGNLFRKRKKLPSEELQLSKVLVDFFNSIPDKRHWDGWDAKENIYKVQDKKESDVISIFIDPHDMGSDVVFIKIYYNEDRKSIVFTIIKNSADDLITIQDFLDYILAGKYYKTSEHGSIGSIFGSHIRYWIKLDKIEEIIKEITIENYDLYINANKYNL
jgi:hypothetical protein